MRIQTAATTAAIAGTEQALAAGAEVTRSRVETARQQAITTAPANHLDNRESVQAAEHAADRHGNGRDPYDTFERGKAAADDHGPELNGERTALPTDQSATHIDFQA